MTGLQVLNSDLELAHVMLFNWARDHQLSALILKVAATDIDRINRTPFTHIYLTWYGGVLALMIPLQSSSPFLEAYLAHVVELSARASDGKTQLKVARVRVAINPLMVRQSMELLAQHYTHSGQFIQAAHIYGQLADAELDALNC